MTIDVYERITARIVQQLEQGTVPWRRTWRGGEAGHPRNLVSGHRYRGINTFLLSCATHDSPHWLTFRQSKQLGGHVRKGEKSTPVIFWKWVEREKPETGKIEKFPLLRHYSVFNIEQCDLPPGKVPTISAAPENDFKPIAACERVVAGMPDSPAIHHGGGVASYRPVSDTVQIPKPERFDAPGEYYSAMFHELTHSTGHESRLKRPGIVDAIRFGSQPYSREELIAEMGAAFLCGHCGIDNTVIENSASYIAGWLRKLSDDKRLVVQAAAAAQKAADFILGHQSDADTDRATNDRVAPSVRTSNHRKPKQEPSKPSGRFAAVLDGVRTLGLASATDRQVGQAVRELFPEGTTDAEPGEVIRAVFVHLMRRNSADNVGR